MKHLINHTIYGGEIHLNGIRTDGIELLTGFKKVSEVFRGYTEGVHLPYCVDWYGVFKEKREPAQDVSCDSAKFLYYGRNRKEIVTNVTDSIRYATTLNPEYGVFHACSANFDELLDWKFSYRDTDVVSALTELMNEVASEFPFGEPPFRILFENLWWPGLRLTDEEEFDILTKKLEFDNWGICLDTGHLLISMGGAKTESEAVEMLADKTDSFSDDLKDAIYAMHLHNNTSAKKISELDTPDGFLEKNENDKLLMSYPVITDIDSHLPFRNSDVRKIADVVKPEYINHEMGAVSEIEKLSNYNIQRTLFP